MAFGQQSGPPATHKQLQYLESLVRQAGHDGFRDARYPLGLTQRQAAGRFTRDEASALIDQLLAGETASGEVESEPIAASPAQRETGSVSAPEEPARASSPSEGGSPAMARARARREAEQRAALAEVPPELLADELERRGWTVTPP